MAEIESVDQYIRTGTLSSEISITNESVILSTTPSPSSSPVNYGIQYKKPRTTKFQGVWAGYQTQEEFMNMHLR